MNQSILNRNKLLCFQRRKGTHIKENLPKLFGFFDIMISIVRKIRGRVTNMSQIDFVFLKYLGNYWEAHLLTYSIQEEEKFTKI